MHARTRSVGAAARRPPSFALPVSARWSPPVGCADVRPERGYRMGRWARLAMTLTVLASAVVVIVSGSTAAGSATAELRGVTVAPGDTLWSIAARNVPDRDPRAVIREIQQLNGLHDTALSVGLRLSLPAG